MKHRLARGLRWLVTAVIIVFLIIFARTIDWSAAWASIRGASVPLLVAALAINFLSMAIKGVRWWTFLKPAGAPSLGLSLRATIAGAGLNNILVANGGDAARVVFVSRATGLPSSRVLATLALERLFDPVGFVVLIVAGAVFFDLPPALEQWRLPSQLLLAGIAALLIWFVYAARHVGPGQLAEHSATHDTLRARIRSYFAGFVLSTRWLTTGPRFLAALIYSMLSWAGQVATFVYAAEATNVSMPLAGSLAALLAVNLGLLIRATPGNVGFFQFVYALTAEQFGVSRADAIAVSLLIQTIQIIPLTVIGIALAPEFIFRRSAARQEAKTLTEEHEPILLGDAPEEAEEPVRAAGEP